MAGTAADLIRALSASLRMPFSTVEAYGLALTRRSWWEPTKRGRGARPKNDMDAAKLLLALLASGPSDLSGFFLTYANMRVAPHEATAPLWTAIRLRLDLPEDAGFLDFAAALVRLYRTGDTDLIIWHTPSPEGFLDEDAIDVPGCEMRVKGPVASGSFTFLLSHSLVADLPVDEKNEEKWLGRHTINFAHEFIWHLNKAQQAGDRDGVQGFAQAFEAIGREASGVGFERFIGGSEFAAVANALGDEVSD